jgi:hypothetical protein
MKAIPSALWVVLLVCASTAPAFTRETRLVRNHAPAKPASTEPAPSSDTPTIHSDLDEERRYRDAKTKAENDPEVRKLKLKADTALTTAEARETLIAYNQALFRKVAQLDPGLKEHADLVENAILRRIGE